MEADQKKRLEEDHFYRLFTQVLEKVKTNSRISENDVTETMRYLMDSIHQGHDSDVDFTKFETICVYLFRSGASGAGLTRCRVLDAIGKCEALEQICLREQEQPLQVTSLGGGPGTDMVGFCSALQELGFPESRGISFTVVDAVRQWSVCVQAVERLAKEGQFGNTSELFKSREITTKFVQTKLPANPLSQALCTGSLRNADVILVQRLLCTLALDEVPKIMEIIHSSMKDEALVLVINSPSIERGGEGKLLYKDRQFDGLDLLYLSEAEEYTLSEHHQRFDSDDNITTKEQIAVLRKSIPPSKVEDTKNLNKSS